MKRSIRESALWVLGALGILLFGALWSYNPADPAFTTTGEPGQVENAFGPVGAWMADLFYFLVGRSSFLLPFLIFFAAVVLYRRRNALESWSRNTWIARGVGFFLTMITSSGLASLHFSGQAMPNGAGGILGEVFGNGLAENFSFNGATILLLAFWLTGVSLFTGLSWMKFSERVGRFTLRSIERVKQWRQEREEKVEFEQAKQVRIQEHVIRKKAVEKNAEVRIAPKIEAVAPPIAKSVRVEKERQVTLFETESSGDLPELALLDDPKALTHSYSRESLEAMSRLVEIKLKEFNVDVEVVSVLPGPVVTRFELMPAPGTKVSKIINLSKDIARSLSAISVRVVDVIPGKAVIGLELPNENREMVLLSEIIKSSAYDDSKSPLTIALGKDISGQAVVADVAKMPHLLVAGTTGSGKSVAINSMILSILFKATAEEVRLIMIDPKMLELSVYEGIPHLLAPVVTDMKEAANALRWAVAEMDRRYMLMSKLGVRNLKGFNRKVRDAIAAGQPIKDPLVKPPPPEMYDEEKPFVHPDLSPLPLIVILVDELADMMMLVGKKVEELIARLAQKARASGIHLILATQRPSVDVITGLIKANIPTRIAFQVSSRVDSRTILDQIGAENLLGHGDMLFLPPGTSVPRRVHGAFVDDHEVHRVVAQLKKAGKANYIEEILTGPANSSADGLGAGDDDDSEADPLYDQAVQIVLTTRKASISGVQRRLKIGYNRAARLVETMEAAGLVGPLESNGRREILVPEPQE
ncbi:MAG: cell division protein FtsK [Gammaproteobacteria bacterium]|nr:DNA translocase FtsK 4TM domain-containing protein [Gammaproteobacteria bacterium]NNC98169.1 cell division protein FtsK [Gammaproteobacteria bacterium]NNM13269.1 cell division protein FtsK [Gammaproteobacteria bacterium]